MNLMTLFPDLDWPRIETYYLELVNQADDAAIVTTPEYKKGCCCDDDTMRIFFVNYLGGVDAINFTKTMEELEVQSENWKKPLKIPMEKWDGGIQRFNVTSNEIITAENRCYQETDTEWLKELLATPNAWVQWFGTQGQENSYIPIVILDGKFALRKTTERYNYILQIQFTYANENLILRN